MCFLAAVWMIVFSNFYIPDAPLERPVIDLREPALLLIAAAAAQGLAELPVIMLIQRHAERRVEIGRAHV